MGNSVQTWRVPVPAVAGGVQGAGRRAGPPKERAAYDELRFRPPDEPSHGGYSLRVKTMNNHVPPGAMVAERLAAVREAYAEVTSLGRSEDSVEVHVPRRQQPAPLQLLPVVRRPRFVRRSAGDVGRRAARADEPGLERAVRRVRQHAGRRSTPKESEDGGPAGECDQSSRPTGVASWRRRSPRSGRSRCRVGGSGGRGRRGEPRGRPTARRATSRHWSGARPASR